MTATKNQPAPKPSMIKTPIPGKNLADAAQAFIASEGENPPKLDDLGQAAQNFISAEEKQQAMAGVPANPEDQFAGLSFSESLNKMSSMSSEERAQVLKEKQAYDQWDSQRRDPEGKGFAGKAVNAIPIAGAIAGGIGGELAFPLGGGVPGAAGGAAAGEWLKRYINYKMGNRPEMGMGDIVPIMSEGASSAIGQAGAMAAGPLLEKGLMKGTQVLAGGSKSATEVFMHAPEGVKRLAMESGGDPQVASELLQKGWRGAIKLTQETLEKPAKQVIASSAAQTSAREAGDQIKTAFTNSVKQKYGDFTNAYSQLDKVVKNVAIDEADRQGLVTGTQKWAAETFPTQPATRNAVTRAAENLNAARTGGHIDDFLKGELADQISSAYRAGNTNLAKALEQVKFRANDFLEGRIDKFAKQAASSKVPFKDEAEFTQALQDMYGGEIAKTPGQLNGMSDNLRKKYTADLRRVSQNYLAKRDQVKQDYSVFKDFMSDLQEQTGIKDRSTMRWLDKLDDIPSEKLIKKMYDPNNSRMLEKMSRQSPEIFSVLRQHTVGDMWQTAGQDVGAFHEALTALPKETQRLLFPGEQRAIIEKTMTNPRLVQLKDTAKRIGNKIGKDVGEEGFKPGPVNDIIAAGNSTERNALRVDLGKLSQLTGVNLIEDAQRLAAMDTYMSKIEGGITQRAATALARTGAPILNKFLPTGPAGKALMTPLAQGAVRGGKGIIDMLTPNFSGQPLPPATPAAPAEPEGEEPAW